MEDLCLSPVKPLEVQQDTSVSRLLDEMSKTAFQGRSLGRAFQIIKKMVQDPEVTVIVGYAGSLSVAGMWKMICYLLEMGWIDILVPTGANISEDLVAAMGRSYYQLRHYVDDQLLFSKGINRYYDTFGLEMDYVEMTALIRDFLMTLPQKTPFSSREVLKRFGHYLLKRDIHSIVSAAAQASVPIYCPAFIDSPYGDGGLWASSYGHELIFDGLLDYREFMRSIEGVKKTGVIYIGGGVPKDMIQLLAVNQGYCYREGESVQKEGSRSREDIRNFYYPHTYAVQIVTDAPHWGGLSGCTFEEASSWGKETADGEYVQCFCDATIALPILVTALKESLGDYRHKESSQAAGEKTAARNA